MLSSHPNIPYVFVVFIVFLRIVIGFCLFLGVYSHFQLHRHHLLSFCCFCTFVLFYHSICNVSVHFSRLPFLLHCFSSILMFSSLCERFHLFPPQFDEIRNLSAQTCSRSARDLRGICAGLRGICAGSARDLRGSARDLSSSLILSSALQVSTLALAAKQFRSYFANIPLLMSTLTCLCEVCRDSACMVVFFKLWCVFCNFGHVFNVSCKINRNRCKTLILRINLWKHHENCRPTSKCAKQHVTF